MVLILSEETDLTTNEVTDWMEFYNVPFFRINKEMPIRLNHLKLSNNYSSSFCIDIGEGNQINSKNVQAYWYRRGNFHIPFEGINNHNQLLCNELNDFLYSENYSLKESIHISLKDLSGIGNIFEDQRNKFHHLSIAAQKGLRIPDSIITSDRSELLEFMDIHNNVVTKAIRSGILYADEKISLSAYTSRILYNEALKLPAFFFATQFQEHIIKKYDVRIFYLGGLIYAAAIFSQLDKQTSVDFRNYNQKKQNRVTPFRLPIEVRNKIVELMTCLKMKSGSIDLIYSDKNEFVFLEINPIGQFAQVSEPCNYYLEEKIATYFKEILQ